MIRTDVAIVGGGITGMAAAWYLTQQAPQLDVTLLESGDRWGGKILTDTVLGPDGAPFVIEGGPDSFITQKPWALQLARALGMEERLLPTNDDRRQTFVLNRGRPVPLPDGVMLIVPTKFQPFVTSPLISPWGKLRMGMEWFIRPKTDDGDETLAEFIQRRLGREALDKIAEPLLSGIYNADANLQSVMATFPRFRAIEKKYGSLTRGMLAAMKARRAAPASGKRPPSAFISFRGGMRELVDRLAADVAPLGRLNTAVTAIEPGGDGRYRLTLSDGTMLDAASVLLAVPASAAARLVEPVAPYATAALQQLRTVSTGTISLAFRRDTFEHPLDGFGIVIPRSENREINAITWSSTKFDARAPEDHVLLRVFFGGSRTPQMMDVDDDTLLATVLDELREIMGVHTPPVMHRIYRWFDANPQYDVNHLERVAAIEAALPAGLVVAGSPYRGIGVPDCVRQAGEAAEKIATYAAAAAVASTAAPAAAKAAS